MGAFRTGLALLVVIAHIQMDQAAQVGFSGGAIMAVRAFFLISGFYMALVLNGKYRNAIGSFYKNRIYRLYPLYLLILVITLVIYPFLLGISRISENWGALFSSDRDWLALWLVFSNFTFFGLQSAALLCVNLGKGAYALVEGGRCAAGGISLNAFTIVGQAWTLGLEVLFYLIAPFILRRGPYPVVVLLIVALIGKITITALGWTVWPYDRHMFPLELVFFLGGSAAYFFYRWVSEMPMNRNFLLLILFFVFYLVIIYTIYFASLFYSPSYYYSKKIILDIFVDLMFFSILVFLIPFVFILWGPLKMPSRGVDRVRWG